MAGNIELAEMIGQLRHELTCAVNAANPPGALRFELGPVGLEVTVAVSKGAAPGAKVKFWIVEAGTETSVGKVSTQKITLTLHPTVNGGSAYVTGAAEPDED